MTDYWIFTSANHNTLAALTIENMKLGWKPLGAPFVVGRTFYQAMVR